MFRSLHNHHQVFLRIKSIDLIRKKSWWWSSKDRNM